MATSFAEAFKLARASKPDSRPKNSPISMNSAPPQVERDFAGRELWTQEAATVKPIGTKIPETSAIQKLDGLPVTPAPASSPALQAPLPETKAVHSGAPIISNAKKVRNANLEEYYQRAALVKAAQRNAKQAPQLDQRLADPRSHRNTPSLIDEDDSINLTVAPDAQLIWNGKSSLTSPPLKYDPELGMPTQISSELTNTRDVVLGFDFGTSSAKVVIGDRNLKKAHAVPFRDLLGIDAYLLPARLYEANGIYSLREGAQSFDDLKLELLARPNNDELQCRVVAFLGLAIREARSWLFEAHADDYSKTHIVWTLSLGLPAESVVGNDLTEIFRRIGAAAWSIAGGALEIGRSTCENALAAARLGTDAEIVVTVTPEIAAQVYGFVNSRSFDHNARNFFLIADVGAGTVDTCLFRVTRAKGGRWSFVICTTAVEPSGVMNLHRHRIAWWQQHLTSQGVGANLCKELESVRLPTENQMSIPESYDGYLSGVTVRFTGKAVDPDREFFAVPVLRQVRGHTLYRAFKNNLLDQKDIANMPFFLCGGGTRLRFYQNLVSELSRCEGFSWLNARGQELVMPDNIRADGVKRSDYDRLSVAYGLSMLDLATLSTMPVLPVLTDSSTHEWRSHYVDKDQC